MLNHKNGGKGVKFYSHQTDKEDVVMVKPLILRDESAAFLEHHSGFFPSLLHMQRCLQANANGLEPMRERHAEQNQTFLTPKALPSQP